MFLFSMRILIQSENIQNGKRSRRKKIEWPNAFENCKPSLGNDGVGEAGFNIFELIPAVVTLSQAQMFK